MITLNTILPLTTEQMILLEKIRNPTHKAKLLQALNTAPSGSVLNLFQTRKPPYANAIITTNGKTTLIFG